MNRRDFLRRLSTCGAGAALLRQMPAACVGATDSAAVKGFIVSDAHFGWENAQQPSPERQRAMMAHIATRFPELDVLIDTGDAHHNGRERDPERGLWTDIIAGAPLPVPFYYVPGNHEIAHSNIVDPETVCNRLGSMWCRPYYSFTIKGIHFVSLPELMRAVYLTRESLEWLELDLEVHRAHTTLLLSHNNVTGTTGPVEPGYRGIVNSAQLMEVLGRYPNVLGWLHGHNHNYEVVEKSGKLFVSNGRIGGFDPSRNEPEGSHGLGGVYFEVRGDGLLVRSYSAERGMFLDEAGISDGSGRLAAKTSLDPNGAPACRFGYGGARDGQRLPVYRHHAATGGGELFLKAHAEPDFNDDPEIVLHTAREVKTGAQRMLMGASVHGAKPGYAWLDPGLRVLPRAKPEDRTTVLRPRHNHGRFAYYRCAPGRRYRLVLDMDAHTGGQQVAPRLHVFGQDGESRAKAEAEPWTLDAGIQSRETVFTLPDFTDKGIYADPDSDLRLHVMLELELTGLAAPVDFKRIALMLHGPGNHDTVPVGLAMNGVPAAPEIGAMPGQVARAPVAFGPDARTVCEVRAGGSGRVTWLVRVDGLDWQVRNAPVADHGAYLEVGPMRNRWQREPEVVIAPAVRTAEPFIHRLRGITRARVYPLNRGNANVRAEILEAPDAAAITVVCGTAPNTVHGASNWHYEEGKAIVTAPPGADVRLVFA